MSAHETHAQGVPMIQNLNELPKNKNIVLFVFLPGCGACIGTSPWVSDQYKELKTTGKSCLIRQCNIKECNDQELLQLEAFPTFLLFDEQSDRKAVQTIVGGGKDNQNLIKAWIDSISKIREGFHGDYDNVEQSKKRQSQMYNKRNSRSSRSPSKSVILVVPRHSISSQKRKSLSQMCNNCVGSTCKRLGNC